MYNELYDRLIEENVVEADFRKIAKNAITTAAIGGAAMWGAAEHAKKQAEKPIAPTKQVSAEKPSVKEVPIEIPPQEEPTIQRLSVDLPTIAFIESSNNPKAVNKITGARGLYQFMEKTWYDLVKRLRKDWSFDDAFDPEKSRIVADYYFHTRIPEMLNSYGIEDNLSTRLAAYNWGIGHLKKSIDKYGDTWVSHAPSETQDYIAKYSRMMECLKEASEDFEDVFKPASNEEALRRVEYQWIDILEFLKNAEDSDILVAYGMLFDFVCNSVKMTINGYGDVKYKGRYSLQEEDRKDMTRMIINRLKNKPADILQFWSLNVEEWLNKSELYPSEDEDEL